MMGLALRRAVEHVGLRKVIPCHAALYETSKAQRTFSEVRDVSVKIAGLSPADDRE